MRNPFPYKRTVFIFLSLHTAIIIMPALLAAREDIPLLAIICGIAAAVALTIFTAHNIIHRSLARQAQELQAKTKALDNYAVELRLWAGEMSDQKRALKERVDLINEYSERLNELLSMIEIAKEAADETKLAL